MSGRYDWRPDEIANLKRWCAEGVHLRDLAFWLGRSYWAVSRKRNDLKLHITARAPYRRRTGGRREVRIDPEVAWKRLLNGRRFS